MLYTALLVFLFWFAGSWSPLYQPLETSIFGEPWDMISPVFGHSESTQRVVSAVLMFVISLQAARLAIANVIFLERTYMPSMIFVIIGSTFYSIEHSLAPLVATFFLVFSFWQGLRSYTVKTLATRRILSAGFFLGVAAFVYPPAVYLLPLIFVMLSIFRIDNIREWIVGAVSVCLPMAIYLFTLWVMGRNVEFAWMQYYHAITLNDGTIQGVMSEPLNVIQYTFILIVVLLFVLSIVRFLRNAKVYKRRSALGFGFFVIVALWTMVVMFVSPVRSFYMLPILGFALSIVIPTYFAASRPTFWTNFLYAILILSSIAIHFV